MNRLGPSTSDGDQRRAINQATDELDALRSSTQGLQQHVGRLHHTCQAQQTAIVRLQAALQAVCDTVVDL